MKDGKPAPENHPWKKYPTLTAQEEKEHEAEMIKDIKSEFVLDDDMTEEDVALEEREDLEDRMERNFDSYLSQVGEY